MNDITNGLREEIERVQAIYKENLRFAEDFLNNNKSPRNKMFAPLREMLTTLAHADRALNSNDPDRMAAALEILRGIKE